MRNCLDFGARTCGNGARTAWKVPVVAMATPVDPILTAIERDRIAADVAFVTSVNRTDQGKAAQGARAVTQAGGAVDSIFHLRASPVFTSTSNRAQAAVKDGSPHCDAAAMDAGNERHPIHASNASRASCRFS